MKEGKQKKSFCNKGSRRDRVKTEVSSGKNLGKNENLG